MDKKITRRVAIGTVIGGLAVAPFVMWGFRGRRSFDMDFVYGRIPVLPENIDSDLPLSERVKALEIFERERNRWLSFRGMEGTVQLKRTFLATREEEVSEEGFLHVSFDLREPSNTRDGEHAPHNLRMSFSESKNAPYHWAVGWRGRVGGRPDEMSGTNGTNFGAEDVYTLLLPFLISGLTAVPNALLSELVSASAMRLFRCMENVGAVTYVFGASTTLTSDGYLIPTYKFTDGHFSGYVPKRLPNAIYPKYRVTRIEESDGFPFPVEFESGFVANGNRLTDSLNTRLSIVFKDIRLFTV
jgi:hypothetical protein